MACPHGTVDDGFLEFIIGPDPVAQRLRNNSDLILRSAFRRVSKDGRESMPCIDPSRRAAKMRRS
jgi:hypothetical protein